MAIDGGKIVSYLELDATRYQSAMAKARAEATLFGHQLCSAFDSSLVPMQRLTSTASGLQNIGSRLSLGVTAPLVGVGVSAGKMAIDFEGAFAGIRKTVDATESQYAALADGIKAMSQEIPQSATELAGIMEIAGQLGVDQGNLLSFTETIANLGVATNLSGEEAATMLAQYANVMGMPLDQIGRLGSTIVAMGNNTATTERDIAELAQRLAGTGNLMGLTNAQVMGLSATMASLGINAEAGGSAMSRTLQKINSAVLGGGQELSAFARVAGASAQDFAAAWRADPMTALDQFVAGIGRINSSGGDAAAALADVGLNDLRITDTVLRLSGAEGQLAENISLANSAWASNTALQAEADQRYETTESKLQIAKNSISNMLASSGEVLLPIVSRAADAVSGIAQGFAAMDEGGKKAIVTVGGIAAAIGPVMTVAGTVIKLMSGPAGWVALLAGAGVAGAVAINNIRQAAIRADLEGRFGDIALSAEEMDEAIDELFADDRARHMPFSADLSEAQETLDTAIDAFSTQTLTVDKMMIRAGLGLSVDQKEFAKAAANLALQASEVINAQRKKTTMYVDAVFGANDPQGEKLKTSFNAYFDQADADATTKGLELAEYIEQGLQDGFLDETEQATIQALRQELITITNQAASIDTKGAQLRFRMEASEASLDADSLRGLQERANEVMQAGADEIRNNGEQLLTATYNIAAMEGWSDDRLRAEIDTIKRQIQQNLIDWQADTTADAWQAMGQRVTAAYTDEMAAAQTVIDQAMDYARGAAERQMRDFTNLQPGDDGWAEQYAGFFKSALGEAFTDAGWSDLMTDATRDGMADMYEALQPQHEALRQLAAEMGDELPAELRDALDQLNFLEILATAFDPRNAAEVYKANFDVDGMLDLGQQATQATAEGMEAGSADIAAQGDNAIQGFMDSADRRGPDMYSSGYRSTRLFVRGMEVGLDAHSPSRVTAQYGDWAVDGYVGSISKGLTRTHLSGVSLAQASLQGLAQGLDAHSPSRAMGKYGQWAVDGYAKELDYGVRRSYQSGVYLAKATMEGIGDGQADFAAIANQNRIRLQKYNQTDTTDPTKDKPPSTGGGSNGAAAAEAARQQALVDGIRQTAAATLAADQAAYRQRMDALNSQYQSLMDFAGSHAVWYQDDKGETEVKAAKKRYDDLIDEENKRYEAEKKRIEAETTKKNKDAQQQRLDALKEAHEERTKTLKEQRDEEAEAMKKQYNLQKEMATAWLNYQKSLLSAELSAKRAAYAEDDYQDELAELQKRQRQSKSAREKRELQEQIDKMIRDHALEAEEAALQETLAGYDALIEAVGKGLIGLGDLTGSSAYGDLSFGTAGLSALDNLTAQQLQNVLDSLDRGALSGGVGATVSSAQMAAALRSASGTASAPVVVTQEGRNYTIDLRGAIVRDDSDIDRIVDEMDRRIRAAGR